MTMHITILTIGSRGDVQPLIALGVGLQQSGYQVRLATHSRFESLVRRHGLEFSIIDGDPQDMLLSDAAQAMITTRNPFEFNRCLNEAVLEPILSSGPLDSWKACQGTDVIVSGNIAFWGIDIAERLNIPCYAAFLQPFSPTRAFPTTTVPPTTERFGGLYNRLSFTVVYSLMWQLIRKRINEFRQVVLQLPSTNKSPLTRMQDFGIPILSAVSPSVIPIPSDWTDTDHMTGYWFLDCPSDYTPPCDLMDFIVDGSPPVYIGFGSMAGHEAERSTQIALAALKKTGQRGVLTTGWSGFSQLNLPDYVFQVNSIPHDWLFPQMRCIIHHGGAGTTAATFRSGIPGIPTAFLADQPFWAYRAFKLGVSPAPIDRRTMTVEQLAEAILETIHDSGMRNRATELGKKIRQENGVAQAVNIIDKTIKKGVLC